MRPNQNQWLDDDRGAVLVIVAISLIALIAVGGLAIDGGRAYALRRQMQNSADAAALDATRVLDQYQQGKLGAVTPAVARAMIHDAAVNRAKANGANDITACKFVLAFDRSALGDCDTADPNAAFGVQVGVTQTEGTILARAVGNSSYTANTTATAEIGKPSFSGNSPFAVCGTNQSANTGIPVMIQANNGNWVVNPDAIGKDYYVWGPQQHRQPGANCGLGAQWKGLISPPGPYPIPGLWTTRPGTVAGPTRQILHRADECGASISSGCVLAIPLCPYSQSGKLYCTDMGLFQVKVGDSNSISLATFLGSTGSIPLSGSGGITGPADPGGSRKVVLTD